MSKEAMKLALKRAFQLGQDYWYQADHESYRQNKKADETLAKFRQLVDETCEALAKPDFWEGYEPEPVKSATTETNGGKTGWPPGLLQDDCKGLSKWLSNKPDAKRRVREALDKKAENARELGLDYEPARDSGIVTAGGADPRTQRTWVGLTDEEIARVVSLAGFSPDWAEAHIATQIVRVLEAKLKEKNT